MSLFKNYIKPSFIILGGVKCGTSSLYRYLNQHPNVLPCKIKEPRIFNTRNILKTLCKLPWYVHLFPKKDFVGWVEADWVELSIEEELRNSVFKKQKEVGINYISGEASAETFTHAYPWLVKKILPDVKLIVLLRNPRQRFISHYGMNMRFVVAGRKQHQFLTLNDFISLQIRDFKNGNTRNVLAQGLYAKHLNNWLMTFNKNQLYIAKTEDIAKPASAQIKLNQMFRFLGLAEHNLDGCWERFNTSKKRFDMEEEINRLDQFYQPYNEALAQQFNIYFE